jgi:deazaflavin-dependent oxidoreductase (nitroreductase family)
MAPSRRLADLGFKAGASLHRAVLRVSGGRIAGRAFGMPVVELHTVGRHSGKPRSSILGAAVVDGDRIVLVASKGGDERDPDWFKNLMAHPDAELTVGGERRAVRARVATPAERSVLWPRAVATYGGYATYQRRTSREIPMVICEPRS